jgi:hypothetical protein
MMVLHRVWTDSYELDSNAGTAVDLDEMIDDVACVHAVIDGRTEVIQTGRHGR